MGEPVHGFGRPVATLEVFEYAGPIGSTPGATLSATVVRTPLVTRLYEDADPIVEETGGWVVEVEPPMARDPLVDAIVSGDAKRVRRVMDAR